MPADLTVEPLDLRCDVTDRAIDRLALAHDASHYLKIPRGVATPKTADDVGRLLRASHASRVPLTFRSGGTSLSGQAVTDGLLVDTRRYFRRIDVLEDGERVRVQPGSTVASVNAHLARYRRKLGPDPASEVACTIGGVVANNSSGMACGTALNTYRTLESMVFVLPSGNVIDTSKGDADERLRALEPELWAGLAGLTSRVRGNPGSVRLIRRLFSMKNTMGYGVNAFLDYDRPVDVLAHLMIGSEGTLGFVADVVFRTVEVLPAAATGLAVFPTLSAATASLPELVAAGFATIELLDATSLRVAQALPDTTPELAALRVEEHAALLVEFQARTAEELEDQRRIATVLFARLPVSGPAELTTDPRSRAAMWHLRKGLYPAVAGARPSGTTALLEDVVVPVPALLGTCEALTDLFERHGYENSVIFGHAKDGNIHFMLNERFQEPANLERYQRFTEDMVDLILDNGGSLKAEHGTGRIMAPFVRRQYGDELYEVMQEIKRLCDPTGMLNPGVVLSDDPTSYVRDLKLVPPVEDEVDRCVECGFCEPGCPSKDVTMTPRQRIVVRREMAKAEATGDFALLAELRKDYGYDGIDTCAVDGMCQLACPVNINTADLVRRLRNENTGAVEQSVWKTASRHWGTIARVSGVALTVAEATPAAIVNGATRLGRAVLGADKVPLYGADLPQGGRQRRPRSTADPVAVYFPACIGTMFGPANNGQGVSDAFLALCRQAQVQVVVPDGIGAFCCGTPWKSKGYTSGYEHITDTVLPALLAASRDGELPVVCDASSCTEGLETMSELAAKAGGPHGRLRFVDAVEFIHDHVLDGLEIRTRIPSIALHPTCSSTQLGINAKMATIARAISPQVYVPIDWGCCGFAGDRGLLHPELTASATAAEADEIKSREFTAYASSNRTCELGMTRATGHQYQHIIELLEQATHQPPTSQEKSRRRGQLSPGNSR
ncbi:MAG TPA: FAD-binding and (Fe-S)-binding domain-containing protein [Dermatophilaceae bacterium]|jgi:D-lactate dehydrogenase